MASPLDNIAHQVQGLRRELEALQDEVSELLGDVDALESMDLYGPTDAERKRDQAMLQAWQRGANGWGGAGEVSRAS
jgi:hypothetical protein